MRPYFICMTPRTGSTLLCEALKATGIAGRPEEYMLADRPEDLLKRYDATGFEDVLDEVLRQGTTPNGVFGLKLGSGPGGGLPELLAVLRATTPGSTDAKRVRYAFPGLHCIFLTRRHKVRQAVSWWKAIQTQQWVQRTGTTAVALSDDAYDFAAIDHLVQEIILREAAWQEWLRAQACPRHTVVYEDLMADTLAVRTDVLAFLGLAEPLPTATVRTVQKQADALSDAWVARYREEKQSGWDRWVW